VAFNSLSLDSIIHLFLLHMLCDVEGGGQVVRKEARCRGAFQSTVVAFMWDYYG
jgi:hypothetical protein